MVKMVKMLAIPPLGPWLPCSPKYTIAGEGIRRAPGYSLSLGCFWLGSKGLRQQLMLFPFL